MFILLFSILLLGYIFFAVDEATIKFQLIVLLIVHSDHQPVALQVFWLDMCSCGGQLAINDGKKLTSGFNELCKKGRSTVGHYHHSVQAQERLG